MNMTIELSETIGRLSMRMEARRVGRDWNVVVHGGDRPHIGAVALAYPETECFLHCLPGHREGDLAKRVAEAFAAHTGTAVCVSCGIHLDNITPDEIQSVYLIAEKIISLLQKTGDL